MTPLLEMRRVTVVREGRRALDAVDLSIGPDERVAILGANGSGKSTLLKLVTRELYPHPSSGAFRILGRDRWEVAKLRGTLGIVSNDLQARLAPHLTAVAAVVTGFTGHVDAYREDFGHDRVARSLRALEAADASHLAERRLETLSSGEARRVLLARALAHDPPTLLLDEPSTSLDLASAHALMRTVRGLVHAGRGLVLVTHHLEEIVPEIGRVVLLREGRIVADGPRAEVMTAANLSLTFGVPITLEGDGPYRAWVSQP
ncbi:MAG: ABC transporter ATP-binding protein [Fimbriimonas sp.]